MNFKSKLVLILWIVLVIGLVLFGIIYIIIAANKSNQDPSALINILSITRLYIWKRLFY